MNFLCVYPGSVGIEAYIINKKSMLKVHGITLYDDMSIPIPEHSNYFFVLYP